MKPRAAAPVHVCAWPGVGARVLLTHGMAAHTHWWDLVVPHWSGVLSAAALDFRGHGESAWVENEGYAGDMWVDDIETARRELGWERFVLCGHSMGARVALRYAALHPERLRGVAAVDFLPEILRGRASRFARARGRPQPVYGDRERMAERFRLEPDGTTLDAASLRELGAQSVKPAAGGWTWKFDWRALNMKLEPIWEQLAAVRVPALVVRGEFSTVMSREDLARVAAGLPNARALEIARAHHHVPLDEPAALAAAIAEFAAELPA